MPRRVQTPRKAKYAPTLTRTTDRFVVKLMTNGKKGLAERILRQALARAEASAHRPGLEVLEQAHRLSPRDPFLAIYAPTVRYMALFALGRYEEVVAVCRMMAARHPHHAGARRLMTASLGQLGRINEAREALAHTLKLQPDLSSAHVTKDSVYVDAAVRARVLEGLRKAGLKD